MVAMGKWKGRIGAALVVVVVWMMLGGSPEPAATAAQVVEEKIYTYGNDWLDAGREGTRSLDVDLPAEALKAQKLKEIRLERALGLEDVQAGNLHATDAGVQ
jgi:hypothetical protein